MGSSTRVRPSFTVPSFVRSGTSGMTHLAYRNGSGLCCSLDSHNAPSPFYLYSCSEPTGRDLYGIQCDGPHLLTHYRDKLEQIGGDWIIQILEKSSAEPKNDACKALIEQYRVEYRREPDISP